MSPIYTRPIREQAEHDRVIRQLQVRYKRKHEVAINPKLFSPRLVPKLQALARDKSMSEAIRRHAARALKSIASGKPEQLPYDLPPGALDR